MAGRKEEQQADKSAELEKLVISNTFDEAIEESTRLNHDSTQSQESFTDRVMNLKDRTLEALEKNEIDIEYALKIANSTNGLMVNISKNPFLGYRAPLNSQKAAINDAKKDYINAVKLFLKNTNPPFKQKCREVLRAIGMLLGAIIGFVVCYNQCVKKNKVEEVKQPQEEKGQARDGMQTASAESKESKADQPEPSNRSAVLKAGVGAAIGVSAGYHAASFFTRNTNEGIKALAEEATRYCKSKIQEARDKLPKEKEEEEKSSRCCC